MLTPKRGEIYHVCLDPTLGKEQQGSRPVLVISSEEFNKVTQTPIVLPITGGGNFARLAGFAVSLSGLRLKIDGIVRCDQPRVLDLKARNARKIDILPSEIIDDVLARVQVIFE